MKNNEGIAIVGMDCRYPGANSLQEYWENILSLRRQFRAMPKKRLDLAYYGSEEGDVDTTYSKKAAVLTGYHFDRVKYRIAKSTFDQTDMVHWLALDVAYGALKDAGFENGEGLLKERTGVIIGNSLNGEFTRANQMRLRWPYVSKVLASTLTGMKYKNQEISSIIQNMESIYKEPFPVPDADTLAGGLSNTIAGRICNYFNFNGGGYTVDGACSSSLLAVTNGCNSILNGEMDVALVGGVDLSIDPFEVIGFARNGALAKDDMEVFTNRSQGFFPGEGCGVIVLMKESEALAKGIPVYSVIKGWGISSDGKGGMTRPKPETQRLALERAYQNAGYNITDVDMFEAHGTGTPLGDQVELTALIDELKKYESHKYKTPLVGSVKHLIGHTKAAAGIAGVIKAALAVKNGVIPGSKIDNAIHPVLQSNPDTLRLAKCPQYLETLEERRASVSSFGFGGINVHITMQNQKVAKKFPKISSKLRSITTTSRDYEIIPITAPNKQTLVNQLKILLEKVGKLSFSELTDLSISLTSQFKDSGIWKICFVCHRPEQLLNQILEALQVIEKENSFWMDPEKGIYFGKTNEKKPITFLFPGQGAPIYEDFGGFKNLVQALNCQKSNGQFELENIVQNGAVVDTKFAQPSIISSTLQSVELLSNLGVQSDYGIGHSLGEISALTWAQSITKKQAHEIAVSRGIAMSEYGEPNGAMLAVQCSDENITELMEGSKAVITGYNGINNYVLGGNTEDIDVIEERAFQREIRSTRLKVSHAFHTPMMKNAAIQFRKDLNKLEFQRLKKQVVSTVVGETLKESVEIKKHLFEQIEKPVLFTQAIQSIKNKEGVFIEVGPGKTLTKSLQNEKELNVVALDFGNSSVKGLLDALSIAFVSGEEVLFEELAIHRFYRPLDIVNWQLDVLVNPCEKENFESNNNLEIKRDQKKLKKNKGDAKVATSNEKVIDTKEGVLHYIKRLISDKTEIPIQEITDQDRILSQLHLNSLVITEIVSLVAKTFNRDHKVFSEASLLANGDGTLVELSELIFKGNVNKRSSTNGVTFDNIYHWTHIFKRHQIPRKLIKTNLKRTKGEINVQDYSGIQLAKDWKSVFEAKNVRINNGIVFVYRSNSKEEVLVEFLKYIQELPVDYWSTFMLVEIVEDETVLDLKPVFKTFLQEFGQLDVAMILSLPQKMADKHDIVAQELSWMGKYKEVHYDLAGNRSESEYGVYFPKIKKGTTVIQNQDVILATGGGKGITFESIFALAVQHNAIVILLGRAEPANDETLTKNLKLLQDSNIDFDYYAVDVCNTCRVKQVVDDVEKKWGTIHHILHGAGINKPKPIHELSYQDFQKTTNVKILGLDNIVKAIRQTSKLKTIVTYGSIIAQSGMQRNADYAWANDQLAIYTSKLEKEFTNCKCMTLEWSVWNETGMGVALNSIEHLKSQGIWPIPIHLGVEKLKQLYADPTAKGRYVITSRFNSIETLIFSKQRFLMGRFIGEIRNYVPGVEMVSEVAINLKDDVYLKNHVFNGQYVFPTVMILEGMAQCCLALDQRSTPVWNFENLKIHKSIFIPKTGNNSVRFIITRVSEDTFRAVVMSEDSDFEVVCFEATVNLKQEVPSKNLPIEIPKNQSLDFDVNHKFYDDLLFHNGPFRRIKEFYTLQSIDSLAKAQTSIKDSWFGAFVSDQLILGDTGLNDAAIHCHQACRPSQQLLPTGARNIYIDPSNTNDTVYIKTMERYEDKNETIVDVFVYDEEKKIKQVWEGMILTNVKGVIRSPEWNSYFLAPFLEYKIYKEVCIRMHIEERQLRKLIMDLVKNGISELQLLDNLIIELLNEEESNAYQPLDYLLVVDSLIKIQNIPEKVHLKVYQISENENLNVKIEDYAND